MRLHLLRDTSVKVTRVNCIFCRLEVRVVVIAPPVVRRVTGSVQIVVYLYRRRVIVIAASPVPAAAWTLFVLKR